MNKDIKFKSIDYRLCDTTCPYFVACDQGSGMCKNSDGDNVNLAMTGPCGAFIRTKNCLELDNDSSSIYLNKKIWDYFNVLMQGAFERGVSFCDALAEVLKRIAEVHGVGVSIDTYLFVNKNKRPTNLDCESLVSMLKVGNFDKLGNADRHCTNCGKRYSENDSFCGKCGNERKWS